MQKSSPSKRISQWESPEEEMWTSFGACAAVATQHKLYSLSAFYCFHVFSPRHEIFNFRLAFWFVLKRYFVCGRGGNKYLPYKQKAMNDMSVQLHGCP